MIPFAVVQTDHVDLAMMLGLDGNDLRRRLDRTRRREGSGQDLFDVAQVTSRTAFRAARKVADRIEERNKMSLDALYVAAVAAPGRHLREPTSDDFGFSLVVQALGTGVAWSDNHPDVDIKLPRIEYHRGQLY